MLSSEVAREHTGMVRAATMLPVMHSTLDALEAAILALDLAELGMRVEFNDCRVNVAAKIANISVIPEPHHVGINPSKDMLDSSVNQFINKFSQSCNPCSFWYRMPGLLRSPHLT
jgi:hypothetical protein